MGIESGLAGGQSQHRYPHSPISCGAGAGRGDCPEPCCLTACPWYDFRDLLFLHLNPLEIPQSQPIHTYKDSCCYLSPRACTLSRITRTWICTWYRCPGRKANLKKRNRRQWETINRTVSKIKRGHEQLEVEFIRALS